MHHHTIFVTHISMAYLLDLLPFINKETTRRQEVLIEIQFDVSLEQDGLLFRKTALHKQRNVLPVHSMVLPATPGICDAILFHTSFHISVSMPYWYSTDIDCILSIRTLIQTSHRR